MFKNLLLFFLFSSAFSQTLHFTIKDEQGVSIPTCNIVVKEKSTNAILEFGKIYNGNADYIIKKNYTSILIDIQSVTFLTETVVIDNPLKDKTYTFDIVLKKSTVKQLDEVIIKTPERPYKVKKDTVVFDVEKYRDGSERKVEDLLKKLPGVQVDANGSISYKGKQLETVTLDGDNIFNSNYKLGTKNINIDMVEQIEAIENYSNNRLLKGIESDGKVSLNLKLKKGKSDYSGNLENALGLKNNLKVAYYSNSYIMQISSKVKSFSTLDLNNIGRSDSYFYEKQNIKSLDRKSEEDFKTTKLLVDDLFSPALDPVRFNRNRQFYISYNSLFKISDNTNFKANFNFIDDKIDSEQNVNTKNFINNSTFETNDNFSFVKRPQVFTGEFELKINTTKSTLFEVYSKQYFEKTKLFSDYTKNNQVGYNNTNQTDSYFSVNKLVHTWKVSPNKALQANLYYAFNKIPQIFTSVSQTESISQSSEFKKSTLLLNYNLIGKYQKMSYTFQLGSSIEKTPYLSDNFIAQNNSLFLNSTFYNHSRVKFGFKRIAVIPSLSLTNYRFTLTNTILSTTNNLNNVVIEPSVNVTYTYKKSTLSALYSNTQKPISEENVFTERVFVNNRTTILNNPSFDFQKTDSYVLSYFYNDLASTTTINFSTKYEKSNGQYLSDFSIDQNTTVIKNVFYNVDNSALSSSLRISRFFEKLSSTLTFDSNYINTEYPNFLNSTDIRKNSNQIFKNTFEIRTGFAIKMNFENSFSHNSLTSKSILTNRINSLQNSFKIRYKLSKKSNVSLKSDFYLPNLKNSANHYNFLDFEYKYKLNDKINCIMIANNLLNLKSFNQVENNDFSSYISQTNLTQRFFLLNIEYSF